MGFFKKKDQSQEQEQEQKLTWQQSFVLDMKDVLLVFACFLLIYMTFFRVVVVIGPSMNKTLYEGDRLLLVSNVIYRDPKPGDIIVASKKSFRDGECIVKRVIAVEGQEVDIDFVTGTVKVDGKVIQEKYISSPTISQGDVKFPLVVDKGHVFVMGDNRMESLDSRSSTIGLIDKREILGKAIFLISPGNNRGTQTADYDRIGVIG